jgi:general stress protein YciG
VSISTKKYPNRGFASMSPEKRRAIASMGGKSAHQRGVAHQWTRDEAVQAGSKGGRSTQRKRVTARAAVATVPAQEAA